MPGWTEGEKTAFKTLFILGGIFGIIALFTGLEHNYLLETTSTLYGGVVDPELMELNEILYVDKKFYFPELKREIIKLKSNELGPHLKTSQTRLTQFIAELQNKVNNDLKVIIDLYLQAHAQMITQKKENDTFARSHLTNYENILLNHLTQGELETLRAQQKDTLALEQHFNYLNRKPYFLS
ncbi:hypothetical protein RclHR1_03560007 [Rhizophagus clarus]|nr:hypothetical protein RclHR1_03560007 [Rhizophagus clarus]